MAPNSSVDISTVECTVEISTVEMFPLIGQQGVGKRSISSQQSGLSSSSSNFSVKFPKLAPVSTELLYKHLQNSCGAKEIVEITKNGFFEGVFNGENIHINFQRDNFLDIYTTYMRNLKSFDSNGYEVVKNAVLERSVVEQDEFSIKYIQYLLGLSKSVAGRFRQMCVCKIEEKTNIASSTSIASSTTSISSKILLSSSIISVSTNLSRRQESDTPIYPESEDGALCTSLYHMYLKDNGEASFVGRVSLIVNI